MALNSLFCADVPLSNYSLTPLYACTLCLLCVVHCTIFDLACHDATAVIYGKPAAHYTLKAHSFCAAFTHISSAGNCAYSTQVSSCEYARKNLRL